MPPQLPARPAGGRCAGGQPAAHRRHRRARSPRLLAGRGTKTYQTVTGKGFRPRPLDLGKWRPVVGAGILLYFFATVVGPLLVLLYASLLPFYQAPSIEAFQSFTLDNYRQVFEMNSAGRAA